MREFASTLTLGKHTKHVQVVLLNDDFWAWRPHKSSSEKVWVNQEATLRFKTTYDSPFLSPREITVVFVAHVSERRICFPEEIVLPTFQDRAVGGLEKEQPCNGSCSPS
ncbi:hypothetical protein J6590_067846 [Homalodisca vitripennis]|nr:hypothetical protein J6590_067846 [Homalodisca vitripennis]